MKSRILFKGLFISVPLALTACTDPLAGIERIEDVEVAADITSAQAVPDAAELAEEEGGFFSELSVAKSEGPSDVAASTEATLAETAPAEAVEQASKDEVPGGFFGLLRRLGNTAAVEAEVAKTQAAPVTETAKTLESDVESTVQAAVLDTVSDEVALPDVVDGQQTAKVQGAVALPSDENDAEAEQVAVTDKDEGEGVAEEALASSADQVETPKRRGLLALLGGPKVAADQNVGENGTQAENLVKVSADASESNALLREATHAEPEAAEPVRTASLSDNILQDAPAPLVEPSKRRGLFSGGAPRAKSVSTAGPGVTDVSFGTVLPYGSVGRVCDANRHSLGRKLDRAPARGNGYVLYDSNADSATARTFYVTGFADGCPRQFTAALALFGAPSVHEQLRYGRPSDLYPYSKTDQAYEKVKSNICRVGKRKPCGDKISKIEKNTIFISTYEHFEDNARWADILIHDGAVLATALKTP